MAILISDCAGRLPRVSGETLRHPSRHVFSLTVWKETIGLSLTLQRYS